MGLLDLKYQVNSQLMRYQDIIKMLSQNFNIGEIYLQKLCRDLNIKTGNSYAMALDLIYNELSTGLDINQIILKYNLDKELI